jgi:hypothetical protein
MARLFLVIREKITRVERKTRRHQIHEGFSQE